jgi:hypothetical protein
MTVQRVQSVAERIRSADLWEKFCELNREIALKAECITTLYMQKAFSSEMCVQFKWETKLDM